MSRFHGRTKPTKLKRARLEISTRALFIYRPCFPGDKVLEGGVTRDMDRRRSVAGKCIAGRARADALDERVAVGRTMKGMRKIMVLVDDREL
jgi:hypothetical protein